MTKEDNRGRDNLEVVLHKETYGDAYQGHQPGDDDLRHISMVHVESVLFSPAQANHRINVINDELRKAAKALGATHVFGVEYVPYNGAMGFDIIAYGDAYGPRH